MLQFADRIADNGMDVETLHVAQILDRATAPEEETGRGMNQKTEIRNQPATAGKKAEIPT